MGVMGIIGIMGVMGKSDPSDLSDKSDRSDYGYRGLSEKAGGQIAGIEQEKAGHKGCGGIYHSHCRCRMREQHVILVDESRECGESAAETHCQKQFQRRAELKTTVKHAIKEPEYQAPGLSMPWRADCRCRSA